ncbi:MAG: NADH:flavin oxidoreductase/NADH oxidase family protein [Alphaproteobacteria bacterium]|nr:NADH:flavin oxidoreductase/NADH oxidase family protein [Alphaproteobacteria bacterium]
MSDAAILAQPLTLPAETLRNRIVKAAMTEGLADREGRATPALERLYRLWGAGGAGLLISGNVIVDKDHREKPGNVVIEAEPDAEARAALTRWAQAARADGAGFWMQISHAGRQTPALVNQAPKAPSPIAVNLPGNRFGRPVALTEAEILDLVQRFARAARVARETGFTGAQLHAAHGYLVSEFLSPRANQRTDAWGGSLENRARFLLESVKAARAQTGRDFTLSVKLNSADFQKGGFAPEESLIVADWLAQAGVDVIEISGGNYEQPRMADLDGAEKPDLSGLPASTAAREAYFLDFAVEMRKRVKVPLMVTGGFRTAAAMARAVRDDGVALVGLGRPMVVDTDAPKRLLAGAAELTRWENILRVGPGLFGPKSPIMLIKAVNGFGAMSWYYQQIRRLGAGEAPDVKLGLLKALSVEEKTQKAMLG